MALAASALRGLALRALVVLTVFGASGAMAADRAQFNALGYSDDGRYFAFEQFGIQDGSGFAYSEIFLIDLDTDDFVGGAPFRVQINDETVGLGEARDEVLNAASEALEEFGIARPASIIALRGDGEPDDDGLSLSYGLPAFDFTTAEAEYGLSLEIFKAPSTRDCSFFEGDPMGYALLRETDGVQTEIHRDTRVPGSRGCVVTYKFYGVLIPFESFDNASAVAVLSVWAHGFEGPDRRFIALPIGER